MDPFLAAPRSNCSVSVCRLRPAGPCRGVAGRRQDAHRAHRRLPGPLSDAGAVQVLRRARRLADRPSRGARPHHRRPWRHRLGRERADSEVERRDARDGDHDDRAVPRAGTDRTRPGRHRRRARGDEPGHRARVLDRTADRQVRRRRRAARPGRAPARADRHRALGPHAGRAADAQLDGEPAHARRDRDAGRGGAREGLPALQREGRAGSEGRSGAVPPRAGRRARRLPLGRRQLRLRRRDGARRSRRSWPTSASPCSKRRFGPTASRAIRRWRDSARCPS